MGAPMAYRVPTLDDLKSILKLQVAYISAVECAEKLTDAKPGVLDDEIHSAIFEAGRTYWAWENSCASFGGTSRLQEIINNYPKAAFGRVN